MPLRTTRARRLVRPAAALLVAGLLVAGCGSSDEPGQTTSGAPTPGTSESPSEPGPASTPAAATATPVPGGAPVTSEYRPGLAADVYLPAAPTPAKPVVLLVPGGGWTTADRTGLAPLAEYLRSRGNVVVNATYSTAEQKAEFPVPVQDVLCAAAFARRQADDAGIAGGPLVVVGHSAGGHLAALAAVSGTRLAAPCVDPPARIDGLVGLAGVYDTSDFAGQMIGFFGSVPAADPQTWAAGDPLTYAEDGSVPSGLAVLLLHGDADSAVPLSQSQTFAAALQHGGAPTTRLEVVPKVDHLQLYAVDVAGPRIALWLRQTFQTWRATPTGTASSG